MKTHVESTWKLFSKNKIIFIQIILLAYTNLNEFIVYFIIFEIVGLGTFYLPLRHQSKNSQWLIYTSFGFLAEYLLLVR